VAAVIRVRSDGKKDMLARWRDGSLLKLISVEEAIARKVLALPAELIGGMNQWLPVQTSTAEAVQHTLYSCAQTRRLSP
jgi:hypothetical protein